MDNTQEYQHRYHFRTMTSMDERLRVHSPEENAGSPSICSLESIVDFEMLHCSWKFRFRRLLSLKMV